MIHEASCNIEIDIQTLKNKNINIMGIGADAPIPSDEELEAVFPNWIQKGEIFLGRIKQEQGLSVYHQWTPQDLFKFGMKFVIIEAKRIAGI